jgi:Uma2 family endonuclease
MSSAARRTSRTSALLHEIDWRTYSRLLRAFDGRRRLRLTYDRGTLEIMSPLWEHEDGACILGSFIEVLTEELNLPRRAGGSVTLRRRRRRRGLEPDRCYWIASAPRVLGKRRLDLRVDPPPDVAIEIDVTASSLDRMSIYAKLSVPEVWRLDATGLSFLVLQGGVYQARTHSLAFPQLQAADLAPFLAQLGLVDDTALVRQFRGWVRRQLLGAPPPQP